MADTLEQSLLKANVPQNLASLFTPYNPKAIGARIGLTDADPGLFGYVADKNPLDVILNKNANFKQAPHVLPHEYEHVLQNKVNARYGPKTNYDQTVVNEYNRINKGAPVRSSILNSLQQSANNPAIPEYFQKTYGFPLKYFGFAKRFYGRDDGFNLKEQWAEISAAEQFLKKDLIYMIH